MVDRESVQVRPLKAFSDNYIWLIESHQAPHRLVVVDPGDALPVLEDIRETGADLAGIFLTHHHADHIDGVCALLEHRTVPVFAPVDERIMFATSPVGEGQRAELPELGLGFDVLEILGHTRSHIAFVGHGCLFSGDTLFSAGCGRMFEGNSAQMATSLQRLADLPADTMMYCGHEYTAANLRFALAVDPDNVNARLRAEQVAELRLAGKPTLPVSVGEEMRVNPFLRCREPAVREAAERHCGHVLHTKSAILGALRAWKDSF